MTDLKDYPTKDKRFWDIPLKIGTSEALKEMNMARLMYDTNRRFDEVYDVIKDLLDIMDEFKVRLDNIAKRKEE